MPEPSFDDLTDLYEAAIDWPKRLQNESAFYRRLFDRVGVKTLINVACGTGRHAAMFHSWDLRVEGADLSPRMIDRARANFGEPPGLHWIVRGFDQPCDPPEPFDAALCVGNSLALASDTAGVEGAIRRMLAAVRAGGVVVIHALNLWRLPDGPCVWQNCRRAELSQGEALIVKGVHRCGTRGYVEFIVAKTSGGLLHTECVPFLGLKAEELKSIALGNGAHQVNCWGGYQDQPYQPQTSVDLLVVIEK